MTTFPRPPVRGSHSEHLETFNFSSTAMLPSIQFNGFYNQGTPYNVKPETIVEPISPTPLTSELTTLSLKAPLCPLCKGQKYGFTSYFHNTKIFSEPPHDLLPLVEKSYVLKNRLKTLLVNYIIRELEQGAFEEAEKEVLAWSQLVEDLVSEVVAASAGFDMGLGPVEGVRNWTREMTRQIRESIVGRQKLEMPKGRLLVLLLEFRKLWEGAWKQSLLERRGRSPIEKIVLDRGESKKMDFS